MEIFNDEKIPDSLKQQVHAQDAEDEEDSRRWKKLYKKYGGANSEGTIHITMNCDEDGNPLTSDQARTRMTQIIDSYKGLRATRRVSFNADFRTNIDHMERSDGVHFLNHRIKFLRDTFERWTGVGPIANMVDAPLLLLYESLYNDMKIHSDAWEKFWENIKNTVWCERAVGITNTYATALRQQVDKLITSSTPARPVPPALLSTALLKCESVLNLGGKLLVTYKNMVYHPDSLSLVFFNVPVRLVQSKHCCRALTYKYFLIKHNLLMMTNRGKFISPREVRSQCEFELDEDDPVDEDSPDISGGLMDILHRPHTRQTLNVTTNREIRQVYEQVLHTQANNRYFGTDTTTRMCSACGTFEEPPVKFKVCSRCHCVFYCSRECQVSGSDRGRVFEWG